MKAFTEVAKDEALTIHGFLKYFRGGCGLKNFKGIFPKNTFFGKNERFFHEKTGFPRKTPVFHENNRFFGQNWPRGSASNWLEGKAIFFSGRGGTPPSPPPKSMYGVA